MQNKKTLLLFWKLEVFDLLSEVGEVVRVDYEFERKASVDVEDLRLVDGLADDVAIANILKEMGYNSMAMRKLAVFVADEVRMPLELIEQYDAPEVQAA